MTDPTELWNSEEIGLSGRQKERVPKLRDWLRTNKTLPLALELADVAVGSRQKQWAPKLMGELEKIILNQCTSLSAAQQDSQIIGKLVAFLNRSHGFEISQPRLHNLIALPRNPFADGVADPFQLVRAWLEVEASWISLAPATPSIELVVFSAILHGGLLHTSSVVSCARALLVIPEKNTVGYVADHLYVDLTLPWRGQPDMERRTWQPDNQTAALCVAFSAARSHAIESAIPWSGNDLETLDERSLATELFRRILARMHQHNTPENLKPKSLKNLVETVALCAQSSEIPAVIVEYASRQIVSHSLKPKVLRRIYKQAEIETSKDEIQPDEFVDLLENSDDELKSTASLKELSALLQADDETEASDENEPSQIAQNIDQVKPFGEPVTIDPPGLKILRAALRTDFADEAVRRLDEVLESNSDESSIWRLIAEFAKYLLKGRHVAQPKKRFGKNFKLNSAKLYAITVGRRLGRILGSQDELLGGQNIFELPAQSVETLFTGILENAVEGIDPRRTKRRVAQVLREFHKFLVKVHNVPEINYAEVLGVGGGLLPVDANIITPEEYREARRIIRYESVTEIDELQSLIAEVVLILGFRCGTRRMEALGLDISDLIERGPAWLFIRPSEERGLKTPNSTRQLPLTALVPSEELKLLLEWKREFARGPSLFGVSEDLMKTIHKALHTATGTDDTHFHNLRHSFGTWTFLRLMLSDLREIPNLFPHLPETQEWLGDSKMFRAELYGHGGHTRKHALAIASLLGHSGAKVSTEHYLHCLDWLQPLFFDQCDLLKVKTVEKIVVASGVVASGSSSRSTAYSWQDQDGIPVELFRKKYPQLAKSFKSGNVEKVHPGDPAAWSTTAWKLLALYGRPRWSSMTLDDIAENLGLDLATAELMVSRAEEIQAIEEEVGRKAKRHVMEYSAFKEMDIACPKKPTEKELRAVQSVGIELARLAKNEKEETLRILGYYVHHIWKTGNALIFNDPKEPEEAKRYRKFLAALGWEEKKQICFASFDKPGHSKSRRAWANVFGINWRDEDPFELREPPFKKSDASARWIGIEPNFGVDDSGKKLAGSDGFRFLLVMAAIVFGYQSEPS